MVVAPLTMKRPAMMSSPRPAMTSSVTTNGLWPLVASFVLRCLAASRAIEMNHAAKRAAAPGHRSARRCRRAPGPR